MLLTRKFTPRKVLKPQIYSEFAKHWNESNSLDEVISKTEQTKAAASTLASRMRKLGFKLKKLTRKKK